MLSFRPKGGISDSANDRDVSTSLRFARHDRTTFILSTYLSHQRLDAWGWPLVSTLPQIGSTRPSRGLDPASLGGGNMLWVFRCQNGSNPSPLPLPTEPL